MSNTMSQYTPPIMILTFSLENLRAVLPTPKVPAEVCPICQTIGRGGSKLVKSGTLEYDTIPAAVAHLRYFMELGERVKTNWLEICTLCARLYYCENSYEYLVFGSEDCESYILISPEEVLKLPEVAWASRTGKAELHAHASGMWSIIHDAEKLRQKNKMSDAI